jgi:hypothetical protein
MADMRAKGRRNSLTDAEVEQIRGLLQTGAQQKEIAARFNVSKTLITVIKKGYRY